MTSHDAILEQYRANSASTPTGVDAQAVWSRIEEATRPVEVVPVSMFPIWLRFAAAAAVLVAGMVLLARYVSSPALMRYTAGQEMAVFTLPDGSEVALRPHSTLIREDVGHGHERYRLDGEAWFSVVRAERVFEVSTAAGDVRVHGTRFNVRTWTGGTSVYLESGAVSFGNEIGDVMLEPGHVATTDSPEEPIVVAPARTEVYLAWTRDEIVLDATPVAQVLRELSHHYGVRLAAPDSVLATPVSGRFVLGDLDRTLHALSLTTGHPIRIVTP